MQALPHILLVEDDRNIAAALAHALSNSYGVELAKDGQTGLHKAGANDYAVIVLDLNLPDTDGLTICRHLRDGGLETPILILTAEANVITKINLLDAGANDYLTKPFSLGELKARLRVLSRNNRMRGLQAAVCFNAFGLTLNRHTRHVSRDGQAITLRRKEFALLECLLENAGSVVSRNMLNRHAWPGEDNLWTNTLEVHIKHLRDKIDKPFGQPLIHTVHGLGYKLDTLASKKTKAAAA